MSSILERITANKRLEVEQLKIEIPPEQVKERIDSVGQVSFRNALSSLEKVHIIAEIKKASPSKGVLIDDFRVDHLADQYRKGGAAALSVLTEKRFFQGDPSYMREAKRVAGLPVLCKDFIIDPYQIYYARMMGADAILLIARLFDAETLSQFIETAGSMGLDALVEVHGTEELSMALSAGARMVGVNNRNLEDFSVTLETSETLADLIPPGVITVSESGIFTKKDVQRLKAHGYNSFLIGEALVKSENPAALIASLRSA